MRNSIGWLVAIALITVGSPGAAQDGSLQFTLTVDATQVEYSQGPDLLLLVEARNTLSEPLRWHRREIFHYPDQPAAICFQRITDGKRYVVLLNTGFGPLEHTEVLPAAASHYWSYPIGEVVEADENWRVRMIPLEDRVPDDPTQDELGFQFRGKLPVGEYDVFVRFWDGPKMFTQTLVTLPDGRQEWVQELPPAERTPAAGIYQSNVVRLRVVDDGGSGGYTPPPGGGSYPYSLALGPIRPQAVTSGGVLRHRGVEIIRADALASYGVQISVQSDTLVLRRGRRVVTMPIHVLGGFGTPTRRVAIPRGQGRFDVPLHMTARELGFRILLNREEREYSLQPVD
jgi:hypothetical protein